MPLFRYPEAGVLASVQARSVLAPAVAMVTIAELPLPQVFLRSGPFPGVRSVDGQPEAWDTPGLTRTPHFTDGGTVVETLVEVSPGSSFAYELRDFTDVFGRLVAGVRGEWTFTPDGSGSVVRWTWEFKPARRSRPALAAVIVPLYRRYMRRVIDLSVELAERAPLEAGARR